MFCADAWASGSPIDGVTIVLFYAMVSLLVLIAIVSVAVAIRRWRHRRSKHAFWYLLVPIETTVLTAIATSLIGGSPWMRGSGPISVVLAVLAIQVVAWGIAHLLHHEPTTEHQGRDPAGH